ncbi:MAG: tetratricopeptide repeat protein [Nitrospinae bacterium]|nr:tetratricopeptide repeat protein [Nitrospinota bacterium]MDA1108271.1 tetratricopeptide repeat protein [Nitrospinota bacterium]
MRWKLLLATLIVASCYACASFKAPAGSPLETSAEPSFFKKAAALVIPREQAPPALPHEKDLQFAQHQYNLQNYDVAEFYLKKTLLQSPDEPLALKLLPWTYFFQKRYDKALLAFERNHTIHPKDPNFLAGMGWCYLALNNDPQALITFLKAEKFSKVLYDISKGKAIIYLKQKNLEKALPELEKFYSSQEIESILAFWKSRGDQTKEASLPVIPNQPGAASLFSLPVEHPRYRSILWTFDPAENDALEVAWRYYNKKLYRRAIQAFQELPKPLLNSLDAQNGLAWSLLKTQKIIPAELVFKNISQTHPNFIGVVKGIEESENLKMVKAADAEYYLDLKKFRIAEKKIKALKNEFPDWAYPNVQLGMLELRKGNYDAAGEFFQNSLQLDPGNEKGLKGLEELEKFRQPELYEAQQNFKNGDFKEAASNYHSFIEGQQPQAPLTEPLARAYNGLGWSQFQKGQYEQALEKFKKSRKHVIYETDAIKGIGFSNYHLGRYTDASYFLKIAHAVYPEQKQISYKLDWSVMRSWENTRARQYYNRELQKDPLRPSLYMGLGWLHLKQDKPDLAVEHFLKSISLDPDSAISEEFFKFLGSQRFGWQVYNRLGWAFYQQGEFEKSKQMFQTSLKEQPHKSDSHKGMGYSLFRLRDYKAAINYLEQSLSINSKPDPITETISDETGKRPFKTQTTARTRLARAYFNLENYAEAIRHYQQSLRHHPDQADAYDGLGWVYLQLHRLNESRAAFTQAVKLQPMNSQSHRGLREVKQLQATRNIRLKKPDFLKISANNTLPKVSPKFLNNE